MCCHFCHWHWSKTQHNTWNIINSPFIITFVIRLIMPFITRNPKYYLSALRENRTDPLLRTTFPRSCRWRTILIWGMGWASQCHQAYVSIIRCLWLRLKSTRHEEDDENNTDPAFYTFTSCLTSSSSSIESLVLEDSGIDINQMRCFHDFLSSNTSLRGIKFLRTRLDSQSSTLLTSFFVNMVHHWEW